MSVQESSRRGQDRYLPVVVVVRFSEWSEVRVELALVILVARYTTPARRGVGTNEGEDGGEIEMGAATIGVWEIGGVGRLELEGGGEGRSCPAV